MNRIQGKLVLITGASAGIGEACARRFAAEGASLALWARRMERLEELSGALGDQHPGIEVYLAQVDVRDADAVERAAAELEGAGRVPDILVNNAGLSRGFAPLHVGDVEDWDEMIDTNVKGLLHVTRAIVPRMLERGRGHVINLGSTAGRWVYPRGNVYNATKFAVTALTEGLNVDLVGTPIRVSSVSPGFVETEFSLVRFRGDAGRAERVYQGFRPLSAADVADAVAYAANAPEHVDIFEIVMMPTAQRSSTVLHREAE